MLKIFEKHGFKMLVVVIAVQLLVPVGMIIGVSVVNARILTYGKEYYFKIDSLFLSDGSLSFSLTEENKLYNGYGGYTEIHTDANGFAVTEENKLYNGYGGYTEIHTDADGFAVIEKTNKKPDGQSYIKPHRYHLLDSYEYRADFGRVDLPKCVYMDKRDGILPYKNIDEVNYGYAYLYYHDAYAEIYVYNGEARLKAVYIDGSPLEKYVEDIFFKETPSS